MDFPFPAELSEEDYLEAVWVNNFVDRYFPRRIERNFQNLEADSTQALLAKRRQQHADLATRIIALMKSEEPEAYVQQMKPIERKVSLRL